MDKKEKKKNITLSVTEDTDKKINEMSKKYGMTKSGLITFLVNQASEKGIFKSKKAPSAKGAKNTNCEVIIT